MFSHFDSLFSRQQKRTHFSSENQRGAKKIIQMPGDSAVLFIHPRQRFIIFFYDSILNRILCKQHIWSGYKTTDRNDILLRVRRLSVSNKIDLKTGANIDFQRIFSAFS